MVEYLVADIGRRYVPYTEGLALQDAVHEAVSRGTAGDTVILLEHTSVYTAGKRTEESEKPNDGTPVIDVNRGGKITWHGPGQLVGYPIVRLPDPIDVVRYVRDLETALIAVLDDIGVDGHQVTGRSGVWVSTGTTEAKIAAIGVRVADGVTMHGFALNCSNSLEPFDHIVACGIRDAGVTTISRELGRTADPTELVPLVQHRLSQRFAARAGVAA